MTAKELLSKQIELSGRMLKKTIEGLDPSFVEEKVGNLMSPKEQVIHLQECYVAADLAMRGEKHQWGSHVPPSMEWEHLLGMLDTLRAQAITTFKSSSEESALDVMSDFVVAHDHYHIGQLASIRSSLEPTWDPYSIY